MEKLKNAPNDPLIERQRLAEAASKASGIIERPDHEIAERKAFRGTTENLVGDSSKSVFTKFEDYMIKSKEQEILDETDKTGKEFIDNLPQGTPLPSAKEQEMLRNRPGGLFIEEPFDQDKVA